MSASRKTMFVGLVVALICPAVMVVGMKLWSHMPRCQAGDTGSASGCILAGINLNWLIDLTVLALPGAFLFVPLGVLLAIVGAVRFIWEDPEGSGRADL